MRNKRTRLIRILRVRQRRFVAWTDRHAGDWTATIPSWGMSLLVHGTFILLLALYIYNRSGRDGSNDIQARFPAHLGEDLTSLVDSDHSGDPFTKVQSEESPSLSLEPTAPDESRSNQPEIPNLARFGPDLAGPRLAPEPVPLASVLDGRLPPRPSTDAFRALGAVVTGLRGDDMTAPFSGRDEAVRAMIVRREGGTVHSEKAVEDGLNWLIRHQRPDGGWSLDFHGQCSQPGCPVRQSLESETAATGLALLPMLGAGHVHTKKSRYQNNVRTGLAWLIDHQQSTGELFIGGGGTARMYSHAIATMALCEAYGLSHDKGLREPAQRAIDFIAEAQNLANGGWRYQPGQPGDTSVFGWQMFALRSARLSGLRVTKNVTNGCRTYLDLAAADQKKTVYSYMPGREATPVMTAEALLSRQYLGWPRNYPPLIKGASQVAKSLETSTDRNIYYWYYATQLLHNMQNDDWKRWNVKVRDGLVSMQVTGQGCDRGSWDPVSPQPDRWASAGGRLFLTSLSTLTLEVYYRYLPLYGVSDKDTLKLDDPEKPADSKKADEAEKAAVTP